MIQALARPELNLVLEWPRRRQRLRRAACRAATKSTQAVLQTKKGSDGHRMKLPPGPRWSLAQASHCGTNHDTMWAALLAGWQG